MSDAILKQLADVIDSRKGGDAAESYVARLFALGDDAILKKIGEEATEAVLAAKDGERERIVSETADLWFHCMVMLSHYGLRPENVLDELSRRAGTSGIEEQALRKALAQGSVTVSDTDCLFCRISRGEIPSKKVLKTTASWHSTTSIRLPRCTF